jgi:hypothetical protein
VVIPAKIYKRTPIEGKAVIAEFVVHVVFDWIVETMLAGTGHFILSLFSLDREVDVDSEAEDEKSETSWRDVLVGTAFWMVVLYIAYRLVFS